MFYRPITLKTRKKQERDLRKNKCDKEHDAWATKSSCEATRRPSSGLPLAFHLAKSLHLHVSAARTDAIKRCGLDTPSRTTTGMFYCPITKKTPKESAERNPGNWKKGATQSTKMHGKTSPVVRPRAELHWGCRMHPMTNNNAKGVQTATPEKKGATDLDRQHQNEFGKQVKFSGHAPNYAGVATCVPSRKTRISRPICGAHRCHTALGLGYTLHALVLPPIQKAITIKKRKVCRTRPRNRKATWCYIEDPNAWATSKSSCRPQAELHRGWMQGASHIAHSKSLPPSAARTACEGLH